MKISKNRLVAISLKIEDDNGQLIDETEELIYIHGDYGQIFQKLEDALDGQSVGYKFEMQLSPKEAFGEYDESLVIEEPFEELPEDVALGVELESEDKTIVWIVKELTDTGALLDGNHEFAGVPLKVSGEVLEIEQISEEGIQELLNMEHTH